MLGALRELLGLNQPAGGGQKGSAPTATPETPKVQPDANRDVLAALAKPTANPPEAVVSPATDENTILQDLETRLSQLPAAVVFKFLIRSLNPFLQFLAHLLNQGDPKPSSQPTTNTPTIPAQINPGVPATVTPPLNQTSTAEANQPNVENDLLNQLNQLLGGATEAQTQNTPQASNPPTQAQTQNIPQASNPAPQQASQDAQVAELTNLLQQFAQQPTPTPPLTQQAA